jgi:hypothetical protein
MVNVTRRAGAPDCVVVSVTRSLPARRSSRRPAAFNLTFTLDVPAASVLDVDATVFVCRAI